MRFPCCPDRRWGHSTSTVRNRSQATRSTSFARIPMCLSFFRFWSHPPFLSHKTWPPARARRARRRAFWLKDTAETGPWDAIPFRVGGLVVPKFQSQLGSSSPKGKKIWNRQADFLHEHHMCSGLSSVPGKIGQNQTVQAPRDWKSRHYEVAKVLRGWTTQSLEMRKRERERGSWRPCFTAIFGSSNP